MLNCVTEDVVFENVSNTGQSMTLQGKQSLGEIAQLGTQAFTYRKQTITQLICGDGNFAAEVKFKGVAALDLPNGTKKGDMVELRGVSIFETRDGLLSRIADFS